MRSSIRRSTSRSMAAMLPEVRLAGEPLHQLHQAAVQRAYFCADHGRFLKIALEQVITQRLTA